MAITSTGYAGTVDDVAWSQLQPALGDEHGVEADTAWRVTAVAGKERTVAAALGAGYGWGVRDVSDAPVELQAPAPAGTATVWHTIAARRDYASRQTTFVRFTNTAADGQDLAAALAAQTVPGVVTYQGLATFSVRGGATAVQAVVDHRRRAVKLRTAPTLSGLGAPGPGLVGMLTGTGEGWLYRAQLVAGSWSWVRQRGPSAGAFGPTYVGGILESLPAAQQARLADGTPHPLWRSWSFETQFLGFVDVPDQGRSYRVVLDFNFYGGSPFTTTDFSYHVRTSADADNLASMLAAGPQAVQGRQVLTATPTRQVFSGAQRFWLVAVRTRGANRGEVAIIQDELRATPVYAD